jgi:hypothetical protein
VLIFIIHVFIPTPNDHFGGAEVCVAAPVRARVHFHHKCAPLLHEINTLGVRRCAAALPCAPRAHFQLPWLLVAAPGCFWLLLAVFWLLSGCFWLLLAASVSLWLLLAASHVNSRSKENNLFGVLGSYY